MAATDDLVREILDLETSLRRPNSPIREFGSSAFWRLNLSDSADLGRIYDRWSVIEALIAEDKG